MQPVLPDFRGACLSNVVPALVTGRGGDWLPAPAQAARQIVIFVIDGLGWEYLRQNLDVAPTLASMAGGPITTVAPSTTAAALTSLTTGTTPGEHGLVGYRVDIDGAVINALRWSVGGKDARATHPAEQVQPIPPFLGTGVPVVSRRDFVESGFTRAHLRGGRFCGVESPSGLAVEARQQLEAGAPLVYTYHDGLDRVGHVHGVGPHLRAELAACDRLAAELLAALPLGAALLVTADHGMVETPGGVVELGRDILDHVHHQSGEARFRWLHCRAGRGGEALAAAVEQLGSTCWVVPRQHVLDEGWFGPRVSDVARRRLGDVAIVPHAAIAIADSADASTHVLVGRHGSLTAAEMLVPLLAG